MGIHVVLLMGTLSSSKKRKCDILFKVIQQGHGCVSPGLKCLHSSVGNELMFLQKLLSFLSEHLCG